MHRQKSARLAIDSPPSRQDSKKCLNSIQLCDATRVREHFSARTSSEPNDIVKSWWILVPSAVYPLHFVCNQFVSASVTSLRYYPASSADVPLCLAPLYPVFLLPVASSSNQSAERSLCFFAGRSFRQERVGPAARKLLVPSWRTHDRHHCSAITCLSQTRKSYVVKSERFFVSRQRQH